MRRHSVPVLSNADLSGRDDQAEHAVEEILAELPTDHPARRAFADGKDTIALTHLVGRKDLIDRLMVTYWACHQRIWANVNTLSHLDVRPNP